MNGNMSTQNLILIGIALAFVVAGGWWILSKDSSSSGAANGGNTETLDSESSAAAIASAPSTVASDGEVISVASQPAGETVAIASVTLSQTGWVAVRDERGWTLGASRFDAGTYSNVSVELLRATEAGGRYQVLLYHDDGDRAFDVKKESLVTHTDGTVSGVMFVAQ